MVFKLCSKINDSSTRSRIINRVSSPAGLCPPRVWVQNEAAFGWSGRGLSSAAAQTRRRRRWLPAQGSSSSANGLWSCGRQRAAHLCHPVPCTPKLSGTHNSHPVTHNFPKCSVYFLNLKHQPCFESEDIVCFRVVLCRFPLQLRALEVMGTLQPLLLTAAPITTALLYSHTARRWSQVTATHPTPLPLHPASSSSRDSR